MKGFYFAELTEVRSISKSLHSLSYKVKKIRFLICYFSQIILLINHLGESNGFGETVV